MAAAEAANMLEEEDQDEERLVWSEEAEIRQEEDPRSSTPTRLDTNQWLSVGPSRFCQCCCQVMKSYFQVIHSLQNRERLEEAFLNKANEVYTEPPIAGRKPYLDCKLLDNALPLNKPFPQ